MTNKLKNNFKILILIIGVSMLSLSCEKDDTNNMTVDDLPQIIVKLTDFNEIISNKSLSRTLEKISTNTKSSINSYQDILHNSEYGFSIDTEIVKYVESGNYHSYNFVITRDNPIDEKLENLFLSLNNDGGYDAFIIKYDFKPDELNNIDINDLTDRRTRYTPIDFDTSFLQNKSSSSKSMLTWDCNETWGQGVINKGDEGALVGAENVNPPTYGLVLISIDCSFSYSPSNTNETNNDNTTTDPNCNTCNGGSEGGESNPIISAPTTLSFDDKENCDRLKSLIGKPIANQSTPTNVKTLLNELKANAATLNKEMGYFLTPETIEELNFVPNYFEGEENADELLMNLGTNAVSVLMHIHYNNEAENKKQLSVPSLTDLYQIYRAIGTGNIFNPSTFTFIVVTEHGTKYALQLNNPQTFLNSDFATKYFAGWEFDNIREYAEDQYGKRNYNILPNKTNAQNQLQFAKYLEGEDLGMTLFKANDDFTQWSKIEYKNGIYTETPCN